MPRFKSGRSFRLSTALVAVAVVAALFGIWRSATWEMRLIKDLRSRGGFVTLTSAEQHIDGLPMYALHARISGAALLSDSFTDTDLALLSQCTRLEWLSIRSAQITSSGLAQLKRASCLSDLRLEGTHHGVESLRAIRPLRLRKLYIIDGKLNALALRELGQMRSLDFLNLQGSEIDEAGIGHICKLPSLETLNLQHTNSSDITAKALQSAPSLKNLGLLGTRVTAEGVRRLATTHLDLLMDVQAVMPAESDFQLAIDHVDAGRIREAAAIFTELIENGSKEGDVYFNRAICRKRLGNLSGAFADAAKAIELKYADAYLLRAELLAGQLEWEAALEDLNHAIAMMPDSSDAHSNRAYIYIQLADYEKALVDANRALDIDGGYVDALLNKTVALRMLNRAKEAVPVISNAIVLAKEPRLYNERGLCHMQNRNYSSAVADFEAAIELDASFQEAIDNRRHALGKKQA